MKVCILSFTGLNTDGSDATRILKEIRSLVKAGYEVKAIGLRYDKRLPKIEEYYGAIIERIEPPLGFDRQLQKTLKKVTIFGMLKRMYVLLIKNTLSSTLALFKAALKENADVYHCFGIYSLIPGFLLKILKGKKVVYDCVEPAFAIIPRIKALGPFAKYISRAVDFIENILSSRFDYILALSSANNIIENKFKKYNKNIIVLENVPEREFISNLRAITNGKRSNDNYIRLFYMGALTKDKGILKMLESLAIVRKKIRNIKLVLAGSFKETKAYDDVKDIAFEIIHKNNLKDYVTFLGFIPRKNIPKYILQSDIALHLYQPLPWFTESKASSSLFEYLAGGLPVIASDFPGFREIIHQNKCGLTVDPTKPEDIAEKIIYLVENPKIRRKLSINAIKSFEKKYNWSIEEAKLLKVYSILREGGRRYVR